MADGSLEYDLRLRLDRARKDVDRFVKDTEAKLARIEGGALRRHMAREERAGAASVSAYERHEQRKTAIAAKAEKSRTATLERQLKRQDQLFRAAEARRRTAPGAAGRRGSQGRLGGGRRGGRFASGVFQLQQTVEDFSFAGFRGASNNLALLASQMGGPAGIIALGGLAAYSLKNLWNTMREGEQPAGKAREYLQSVSDQVQNLVEGPLKDYARGLAGGGLKDRKGLLSGAFDLQADKGRLELLQDEADGLERAARGAQTYLEIQKEIQDTRDKIQRNRAKDEGLFGRDTLSPAAAGAEKILQDRLRFLLHQREVSDRLFRQAGVNPSRLNTEDDVDKLYESAKAKRSQMEQLQNEIVIKQRLLKIDQQLASAQERIAKARDRAELDGLSGDTASSARAQAQERIAEIEQVANLQLKQLSANLAAASTDERRLALQQQMAAVADRAARQSEAIAAHAQQHAGAIAAQVEAGKQAVNTIDQLLSKERQRLQTLQQQTQAIEDQAKSSRNAFSSSLFDTRRNIVAKTFDERMQKVLEANKGRGLDGKIRKRFEMLAKEQDELLVKARRKELADRAKREFMTARQAEQVGAFDEADRGFDRGREALRELQQLELSQASGSLTAEESAEALKRAEDVQKAIEQSFQLEQKVNVQRRAAAQERLQELDNLKTAIEVTAEAAEGLDVFKAEDIAKGSILIGMLSMLVKQTAKLQALQDGKAGGPVPKAALLEGKAKGGPVNGKHPYIVGEKGPELFVPGSSGSIKTAAATARLERHRQLQERRERYRRAKAFHGAHKQATDPAGLLRGNLEAASRSRMMVARQRSERAQQASEARQKMQEFRIEQQKRMAEARKRSAARGVETRMAMNRRKWDAFDSHKAAMARIRKTHGFYGFPGRASGGPVSASKPYVVGERGPELFIPSVGGSARNAARASMGVAGMGTGAQASSVTNVTHNSPNFGGIEVQLLGSSMGELKDALIREAKNSAIRVAR